MNKLWKMKKLHWVDKLNCELTKGLIGAYDDQLKKVVCVIFANLWFTFAINKILIFALAFSVLRNFKCIELSKK